MNRNPAGLHPELDVLFAELAEGGGDALDHAAGCGPCSAILAEHRELERDLFRLSDPFPPSAFVAQVMAKVAASPQPMRVDVRMGVLILAGAVALGLGALLLGSGLPQLGLFIADATVGLRNLFIAFGHGLIALWRTAAVPTTAALTLILAAALWGLRRLAGDLALTESKVLS
jgi:hypothetical protein